MNKMEDMEDKKTVFQTLDDFTETHSVYPGSIQIGLLWEVKVDTVSQPSSWSYLLSTTGSKEISIFSHGVSIVDDHKSNSIIFCRYFSYIVICYSYLLLVYYSFLFLCFYDFLYGHFLCFLLFAVLFYFNISFLNWLLIF